MGTNTAEKDNPALTARLWNGCQPLRIVLDRTLRLNDNLQVFDESIKTVVFTEKLKTSTSRTKYIQTDFSKLHENILNELYKRNIHSVIIEGGRETLQAFINESLWDEARVFVGEERLVNGILAPVLNTNPKSEERISKDILKLYCNNT